MIAEMKQHDQKNLGGSDLFGRNFQITGHHWKKKKKSGQKLQQGRDLEVEAIAETM